MQTFLYKEYPIGDLKELLAGEETPADIMARQQALETLLAYGQKDPQGKPLPFRVTEIEKERLTDIELTPAEARLLGMQDNRVSLQQLLWLMRAEVTQRPAFSNEVMSLTAYLVSSGVRRTERLIAVVTEGNRQYVEALNAFFIMSKKPPSIANVDRSQIAPGQEIAKTLNDTQTAQPSLKKILLTEGEYEAISTSQFTKIVADQLTADQQEIRRKVNGCIVHLQTSNSEPGDVPFRAVSMPRKMHILKSS